MPAILISRWKRLRLTSSMAAATEELVSRYDSSSRRSPGAELFRSVEAFDAGDTHQPLEASAVDLQHGGGYRRTCIQIRLVEPPEPGGRAFDTPPANR